VRVFVVGVRKDLSREAIPIASGSEQHVPIGDVLDFDAGNWSPIYKPGRAEATIRRIENGRVAFGDRFVAPYYGSGSGKTGRSLERPIGTLTTKDRYCLVDGDRMRMLLVKEALLAQGFPEDYQLNGTRKIDMHLIGNSVPPAMTRHVIERLTESLN
jgi:DNA (cytosine-5)-methyltransferase 1